MARFLRPHLSCHRADCFYNKLRARSPSGTKLVKSLTARYVPRKPRAVSNYKLHSTFALDHPRGA